MECLPLDKIPEGGLWTYELKLDGFDRGEERRKGDYVLCVCTAAIVPSLSGSPQWACRRVSNVDILSTLLAM